MAYYDFEIDLGVGCVDGIGYIDDRFTVTIPPKERMCCTVVAWAHCFKSDFETSNKYLSKFGRRQGGGMLRSQIEEALSSVRRHKVEDLGYMKGNTISLKNFVIDHPKGVYYVITGGHALAVKDGVVYDFRCGLRRRVQGAWKITKI